MPRFGLAVTAAFLSAAGYGRAGDQTDPPMNAAVFEDVPAPNSAPVQPPSTIATVTFVPPPPPPTEEDIDAAKGVARDPARSNDGSIRFDDLPHQIGAHIRVLTLGQRTHAGIVKSADAKQVTLSISQRGGSATFVLPREQIQRIDPK